MNTKGSNHMTLSDRKNIEVMIHNNCKRKEIAAAINKSEKTVSRELELRRKKVENHRYGLYGKKDEENCPKLRRFPFVCNTCAKRSTCFKQFKYIYDADDAQKNYETILRETRVGMDITPEDFQKMNELLMSGIGKGQSIHHIVKNHPEEMRYSERHLYRLIDQGKTKVISIDLRRKVKLKPRKHYAYREDNKHIRKGRTYADYMTFCARNPLVMPVQIDTVEGISSDQKCLLTVHFTAFRMMLIFLLDSQTKDCVSNIFRMLQDTLGVDTYRKLFPVILTDRGSEFCDPEAIELDLDTGEQLSHVFFCDSYSSYQKGAIEENHCLIRYVLPKGSSFDLLMQEQMDLLCSHINSYYRKIIDATPYFVAESYLGSGILSRLHCSVVPADEVNLTPKLLG